MPMTVPLPFPHIFQSSVGSHGDISTEGVSGRPPSADVRTAPVLAKLLSTRGFQVYLQQVRVAFS